MPLISARVWLLGLAIVNAAFAGDEDWWHPENDSAADYMTMSEFNRAAAEAAIQYADEQRQTSTLLGSLYSFFFGRSPKPLKTGCMDAALSRKLMKETHPTLRDTNRLDEDSMLHANTSLFALFSKKMFKFDPSQVLVLAFIDWQLFEKHLHLFSPSAKEYANELKAMFTESREGLVERLSYQKAIAGFKEINSFFPVLVMMLPEQTFNHPDVNRALQKVLAELTLGGEMIKLEEIRKGVLFLKWSMHHTRTKNPVY